MKDQLKAFILIVVTFFFVTIGVKYFVFYIDTYSNAVWRFSYLGDLYPKELYSKLLVGYSSFVIKNSLIQFGTLFLYGIGLIFFFKRKISWYYYLVFFVIGFFIAKLPLFKFTDTKLPYLYSLNPRTLNFNEFLLINLLISTILVFCCVFLILKLRQKYFLGNKQT